VLLAAGGLRMVGGKRQRGWLKLPAVLVAIAVPVLALDGSLNPLPAYPGDVAAYLATGGVGVAFAWYAALRAWRPSAVRAAACRAEAR
jgi:hypothetical protein